MLVNKALLLRIEYLKAEIKSLTHSSESDITPFRVECISSDDKLVKLFIGFSTYDVFMEVFSFLGPYNLTYWGDKQSANTCKCPRKLSPLNQLFLTPIKLKLNLSNKDIAYSFGISEALVSRYVMECQMRQNSSSS